MSKTKAEIKEAIEGIIADQSSQVASMKMQVEYLQTHVVAKVDLDDELVALEKSIALLQDLADSIDGSVPVEAKEAVAALDGESEIQTEEKFSEGDGIVKTAIEGEGDGVAFNEKPPSKKK